MLLRPGDLVTVNTDLCNCILLYKNPTETELLDGDFIAIVLAISGHDSLCAYILSNTMNIGWAFGAELKRID